MKKLRPPRPEIVHDVPSELLQEGSGSGQSLGEQSGFRISILSAVDPLDADRAAAAATAWWQSLEEKGELEAVYDVQEWEPPVYQDYRAPYYRVLNWQFCQPGGRSAHAGCSGKPLSKCLYRTRSGNYPIVIATPLPE